MSEKTSSETASEGSENNGTLFRLWLWF